MNERARSIQGRSSHLEGEEGAREWGSEGRVGAEGQAEIFSLNKLTDCTPVPGAGAAETGGPSCVEILFRVGWVP